MRIPSLPALRWWRAAQKELPALRYQGQRVSDRCREVQSEEIRWFHELVERAGRRGK